MMPNNFPDLARYLLSERAEISFNDEEKLRVQLPEGKMTSALRELIRRYKGEIIMWMLRQEELPKFDIHPGNWMEGCTIYECRLQYIGIGTHRSFDGVLWCDACADLCALWDQAHSLDWPAVWTADVHISVAWNRWPMKSEWWYFLMTSTPAQRRIAKAKLDLKALKAKQKQVLAS